MERHQDVVFYRILRKEWVAPRAGEAPKSG